MPATFAHPVFAIPLARLKLPLSALVFGSMSLDFAHLLPHVPWPFRHNLAGVFAFALPGGLVALWCYQHIFKPRIAQHLPSEWRAAFREELAPFSFGPLPRFLWICIAVSLGALTHLAADHFTHRYGWPVRRFELFRWVVYEFDGQPVRVYRVLQYALSLAGTAVLVVWARARFKEKLRAVALR
jgi:hypothetical protein